MSKITRRDFLKLASAVTGGAAISTVLPQVFPSAQVTGGKPNVLILLFDTMTAPHLSLYGYPRKTTPNLERFAQKATVYNSHYSSGSFTISGTASILTGLYPWNHRAINPSGPVRRGLAGNNLFRAVGPEYYRVGYGQNLWAEMFLRQFHRDLDEHLPTGSYGFRNPLLLGEVNRRDPMAFVAYDDFLVGGLKLDTPYPGSVLLGLLDIAAEHGKNTDPELSHLNLKEVPFNGSFYYQNHTVFQGIFKSVSAAAGRGQPYFGYYHLFSPHGPYAPTKEFTKLFNDGLKVPRKPEHVLVPKKEAINDKILDRFSQVYDQYIANVDAEFGLLMDQLESAGLRENTYVVVLSDHGQLFERGVHGHTSRLLYDQGIHVPLMISAPGQADRQDVHVPTNNVDLVPTLVALTGGRAPEFQDGRVLPGFGGEADESRSVFCMDAKESSAFRPLKVGSFVLVRGSRKLIWYLGYPESANLVELYDLQSDPQELHDLSKDEPDVAKDMLEELTLMHQKADAPFTAGV